jgi:hypothetical protein
MDWQQFERMESKTRFLGFIMTLATTTRDVSLHLTYAIGGCHCV